MYIYDEIMHHMFLQRVEISSNYEMETTTKTIPIIHGSIESSASASSSPASASSSIQSILSFLKKSNSNSINISSPEVLLFLSRHTTELIDLALDEKTCATDGGKKAFLILTNGPKAIIDSICNDFSFFQKATETLSNLNTMKEKVLIVNRLASIFNYIILNNEQASIDSIGFLTPLLKYVEEGAVFDLFHTVFANKDKKLKVMQDMLSITDVDIFVINEMTQSASLEKKLNLLTILNDGLKCKRLSEIFTNSRVLMKLMTMIEFTPEDSPLLLNQIWSALAKLVNKKLVLKMDNIFQKAIDVICLPFEKLFSYHISVFEFLANIVEIKAGLFTENQKKLICQTFTVFFSKFPNSTHLMSAMFKFIRNSLHNRDFAQRVLDEKTISFFIDEGRSVQRTAASANCLVFLGDLDRMKTSSVMINRSLTNNQKYMIFYRSFFKNYLEELNNPYGGAIIRYVSESKAAEKAMKKKLKMMRADD